MKAQFQIEDAVFEADLSRPADISIPLNFSGAQPNAYGVPPATARAYEDGNFIGDTRRGGSCNFEEYRLIPHCNGTHTECVGHIALERISLHRILRGGLFPCVLVSVQPEVARDCKETCRPQAEPEDLLITRKQLQLRLAKDAAQFAHGLVVRTLPNVESKKHRKYGEPLPPYFSVQAIHLLHELGVEHLLVDVPSIDRTHDDGKMTAHHLFWHVAEGSHAVNPAAHATRTITELIFVPQTVEDGIYLLDLQTPNFVADAAPSRPLLYKLTKIK